MHLQAGEKCWDGRSGGWFVPPVPSYCSVSKLLGFQLLMKRFCQLFTAGVTHVSLAPTRLMSALVATLGVAVYCLLMLDWPAYRALYRSGVRQKLIMLISASYVIWEVG